MSLIEVLPEVQSLSRTDKIRLIQVLVLDLERDDGVLIEAGLPCLVPDKAFTAAAAALLQVLAEDTGIRRLFFRSQGEFEVRPKP